MNEGFFDKKEFESTTRPDGKTLSCVSCGLYKGCKAAKMQPYGNNKKGIMIIGEAPGEAEDRSGKPFQGKTGRLLHQTLKKFKVDLFDDCIITNAVNCRPVGEKGETSTPSNHQLDCCRRFALAALDKYKPKVLILLGNAAVYSIIGHRWKKDFGGITKWRGWTIPDQDFKTWICPTFHPSFIERANAQEATTVWEQDLKTAVEMVKTPLRPYTQPTIKEISDLTILSKLKGEMPVAIDYETTGIKPHGEGHKIICASVAISSDFAYVFMMPQSRKERQPFIDLLASKIPKIAQNMKFEEHWSVVRLRQSVQNWYWDTMLASHVLDNRPGITGLKFQTYVQFGIIDYDSEVSPYLQSKDGTNGNSLNRIQELIMRPNGKDRLLHYCGLDAIYEYRLAELQTNIIQLPF